MRTRVGLKTKAMPHRTRKSIIVRLIRRTIMQFIPAQPLRGIFYEKYSSLLDVEKF
jgi:hypothetical protein